MTKFKIDNNTEQMTFDWANRLEVLSFREDATHFIYAPALDLTGYGNSETEAQDSFLVTLESFLDIATSQNTLIYELKRLGWKASDDPSVFHAPYFDEMLTQHVYLTEIVRDHAFYKHTLSFQPA
jgi:hypothetical protein